MRTFATGATRDNDAGKLDYEGFLSPLVLKRYAEYLHKHRRQADGKLRDSDNWQKGIPVKEYLKSKWRHFVDVWMQLRGWPGQDTLEDSICGDLFNTMGMLHEIVKNRLAEDESMRNAKSGECVPITDPARLLPAEAESLKPRTCGECGRETCMWTEATPEGGACDRFVPKGSA